MDMTMFRRRGLLLNTPHIVNESGSIVTFESPYNKVLIKRLICNIEPIQEGEGNPSPENVRPISGWTGLIVYRSGSDTSNPAEFNVTWETETGTVYGGYVDVVSGKLTQTMWYKESMNNLTWAVETINNNKLWYSNAVTGTNAKAYNYNFLCNKYKNARTYRSNLIDGEIGTYNNTNGRNRFAICDNRFETVSAFVESLSDVAVVYELNQPIEIQLTPQEVKTLLGENNIWCDTGGVTVDYWKWGK